MTLRARWKTWMSHSSVQMGLSVGVATGLYGPSFGALAVASGLSIWQACVLSLLMFTGGSQFAFIGVLGGGGSGLAAWSAASLLGIRNGLYGLQLGTLLRPLPLPKPLQAQITIDESMGTATAQSSPDERKRGFLVAGVAVFVLWNIGTLAGALLGAAIGDPTKWGLDGAAVAAFLGLLWPRLKGRDPVVLAVVAAFVTIIAVPFVPRGVPILLAAVATVAAWAWQRRGGRGRSGQGLGQDSGQSLDQGAGQSLDQGAGQTLDQGAGQTLGHGSGQDVGQSLEQGVGQDSGQSAGQDSGQDRPEARA